MISPLPAPREMRAAVDQMAQIAPGLRGYLGCYNMCCGNTNIEQMYWLNDEPPPINIINLGL